MDQNAVYRFTEGLMVVSNYFMILGRTVSGVVVDLWVTLLCEHEISLYFVWTSLLFSFVSSANDGQYQHNVLYSLGASRSIRENVECKLRIVNVRRASDTRRAFWPALGIMGMSDGWNRNAMGVIVISLGTCQSNGENFGCTWESR